MFNQDSCPFHIFALSTDFQMQVHSIVQYGCQSISQIHCRHWQEGIDAENIPATCMFWRSMPWYSTLQCPFISKEEVNHGYAQIGSRDIKKISLLAGYTLTNKMGSVTKNNRKKGKQLCPYNFCFLFQSTSHHCLLSFFLGGWLVQTASYPLAVEFNLVNGRNKNFEEQK